MVNLRLKGNARKLFIICQVFGENWKKDYPDKSISAMYDMAMDEKREPIYAKVSKNSRTRLAEMIHYYDTTTGDLLTVMIDNFYEYFQKQSSERIDRLADEYYDNIVAEHHDKIKIGE